MLPITKYHKNGDTVRSSCKECTNKKRRQRYHSGNNGNVPVNGHNKTMNTRENKKENGNKRDGGTISVTSALLMNFWALRREVLTISNEPQPLNGKCPGCIKTDTLYNVSAITSIDGIDTSFNVGFCNDCVWALKNGDAVIGVNTAGLVVVRPVIMFKETK